MTEYLQQIAFVSMPGGSEWILILVVGLLIFGRRLPEVARNLGKSVNEFKRGLRDFQDSADEVARDVNKITDEVASQAKDATSDLTEDDPYGNGSYGDSYGDGSYSDGTYGDGTYENPEETASMTEEGGADQTANDETADRAADEVTAAADESGEGGYGRETEDTSAAPDEVSPKVKDPGQETLDSDAGSAEKTADVDSDDSHVAPMH